LHTHSRLISQISDFYNQLSTCHLPSFAVRVDLSNLPPKAELVSLPKHFLYFSSVLLYALVAESKNFQHTIFGSYVHTLYIRKACWFYFQKNIKNKIITLYIVQTPGPTYHYLLLGLLTGLFSFFLLYNLFLT
jgi:hypothetical protein